MPSLCTGAETPTPRRPASGSVLSLTALCRHVVLQDPGKLVSCLHPVPSPTTLAFDLSGRSRHFRSPTLRFSWEGSFRDFTTVHSRYNLSTCSPPFVGANRGLPQPTEAFTSGLSTDWSPSPPPDITTGATGQVLLTGLSPVRTPTSIAATAHRTRTGGFPASGSRKRLTHAPTEGPQYGAVTGPNHTQNEETLPGTACIPAALHGVCRRATDAACGGPVGRPRCRLC